MIDNQGLPIGFTMELAMHMDIMKTIATKGVCAHGRNKDRPFSK